MPDPLDVSNEIPTAPVFGIPLEGTRFFIGYDPATADGDQGCVVLVDRLPDGHFVIDIERVLPITRPAYAAKARVVFRNPTPTPETRRTLAFIPADHVTAGAIQGETAEVEMPALERLEPRGPVLRFAERMEQKLRAHDKDRGNSWTHMDLDATLEFLLTEFGELRDALDERHNTRWVRSARRRKPGELARHMAEDDAQRRHIIEEIADVGNGLMFMAECLLRESIAESARFTEVRAAEKTRLRDPNEMF